MKMVKNEMAPALPRRIPLKEPMKVNAFEMARRGNRQLLPLFPYTGPGDIVPCCAALKSDGRGGSIGHFVHTNDVDEVAVLLGGDGARRTGDVFVVSRSHGVGDESDRRRCGRRGRAHEPIDLSPFRWEAIAPALAATEAEEDF
jgi:hypothetical protein